MTEGLTEEQRAALTDEELQALDMSSEEPLGDEDIFEPPSSADEFDLEAKDAAVANEDATTQAVITVDEFPDDGDGGSDDG
jgi:hypothetical protein